MRWFWVVATLFNGSMPFWKTMGYQQARLTECVAVIMLIMTLQEFREQALSKKKRNEP